MTKRAFDEAVCACLAAGRVEALKALKALTREKGLTVKELAFICAVYETCRSL